MLGQPKRAVHVDDRRSDILEARLGGYLARNSAGPPPGNDTIWRGLTAFGKTRKFRKYIPQGLKPY